VTVWPAFLLETSPLSVTAAPYFTTGAEATSEICGGAPFTTTVPVSAGCRLSW
jgi:hypothetical protein